MADVNAIAARFSTHWEKAQDKSRRAFWNLLYDSVRGVSGITNKYDVQRIAKEVHRELSKRGAIRHRTRGTKYRTLRRGL